MFALALGQPCLVDVAVKPQPLDRPSPHPRYQLPAASDAPLLLADLPALPPVYRQVLGVLQREEEVPHQLQEASALLLGPPSDQIAEDIGQVVGDCGGVRSPGRGPRDDAYDARAEVDFGAEPPKSLTEEGQPVLNLQELHEGVVVQADGVLFS